MTSDDGRPHGHAGADAPTADEADLLDLHALGALPADEAEQLERRLAAAGPGYRAAAEARLRLTRETLARMTEPDARPAPPELRERVLAAVARREREGAVHGVMPTTTAPGTPGSSSAPESADTGTPAPVASLDEHRRPRAATLLAAAAVAAVAMTAGVVIGRGWEGRQDPEPPVALPADTSGGPGPRGPGGQDPRSPDPAEAAQLLQPLDLKVARGETTTGAQAILLTSRPADCAVYSVQGLQPAADGRVYQLWLMPEGADPRPAGFVDVSDPGAGVMRSMTGLGDAVKVAMTEEPAGGSPAPSGPLIGALPLG